MSFLLGRNDKDFYRFVFVGDFFFKKEEIKIKKKKLFNIKCVCFYI